MTINAPLPQWHLTCAACDGEGWTDQPEAMWPHYAMARPCRECDGSGVIMVECDPADLEPGEIALLSDPDERAEVAAALAPNEEVAA